MAPRYEDGELIFLNPDRTAAAGDDILIEMKATDGGEGTVVLVRRLQRRTATHLICEQLSPARRDVSIALSDVMNEYRIMRPGEIMAAE